MKEKIKIQVGFIKLPVLIGAIIGLLIIAGVGYSGFNQYENYQFQKAEKERLAENEKLLLEKEQKANKDEQNLKIEELKKEIESLENKPPQIIIKNIPIQEKQSENDLASIIDKWRPKITRILCEWRYSNTGNAYYWQGGSGVLMKISDSRGEIVDAIVVTTNRHVIEKDDGYTPYLCDISLPGMDNPFRVIFEYVGEGESISNLRTSRLGFDWGHIILSNPSEYIKNLASMGLTICSEKALTGDKVVILGYPTIGSQIDITATEGIISGYDGNYYITSAKVEHGNSGGAAILVKNNCYLGIPTFAEVGSIESLARILDVSVILHQQ